MKRIIEVFLIFLRLGLTSFGGPIAHLAYFQDEFVNRKQWLDEKQYAEIVTLCQFLPGPASSQVGMVIGKIRAGFFGSIVAWIGFTFPSTILMILFALGVSKFPQFISSNLLHGCKLAAVVVVAHALWQMGSKLCPDRERISLTIISAALLIFFHGVWGQILVILFGAIIGKFFLKETKDPLDSSETKIQFQNSIFYLILFFCILIFFPVLVGLLDSDSLRIFDSYYRVGSLVFGGGHVVLPLLQEEVVSTGWVSEETFLAGYGAVQAVPGPLFTFVAFSGASSTLYPNGWIGGIFCLAAVFLPSFLLIHGAYPYWEKIKQYQSIQNTMNGINASVVGLLLAAFYNPVWTSAILNPKDFALALILFLLLAFWKIPSWCIVLLSMIFGIYLT